MATSDPTLCAVCGEEVRFGTRATGERHWHEAKRWLHREEADHVAVLGQPVTPEQWAEMQRQAAERAAEHRRKRSSAEEYEDSSEDDEITPDLEPIEVHRINLPLKGRLLVGCSDGTVAVAQVPGGARTVINLAKRMGWDVTRLTYSRGPYIGSKGGSLGVSDFVVLHVRSVKVDGTPIWGVACWRDGKSTGAYRIENNKLVDRFGATALTAWMKENPRGTDPQ